MKKLLVLMLILFVCCSFLFACQAQDNSKQTVEYDDILIMSYNIRTVVPMAKAVDKWTYRREALVKHILSYQPDVCGMQEVTLEQLRFLASNLDGYSYISLGRDYNNTGESSPIFYKTDKYTLVDSGTFWLSETPDVVSQYPGAACRRVCTYVRLMDNENQKEFYHFNTHWDHLPTSEEAREFSASLILSKIEETNLPIILSGDLNTTEDSDAYSILCTKLSDTSKVAEQTESGLTFHNYKGLFNMFDKPIDFIFVTPNTTVYKYDILDEQVDDRYTSDHYAIIAKVRFAS